MDRGSSHNPICHTINNMNVNVLFTQKKKKKWIEFLLNSIQKGNFCILVSETHSNVNFQIGEFIVTNPPFKCRRSCQKYCPNVEFIVDDSNTKISRRLVMNNRELYRLSPVAFGNCKCSTFLFLEISNNLINSDINLEHHSLAYFLFIYKILHILS